MANNAGSRVYVLEREFAEKYYPLPVTMENWLKFADLTKDTNPLHRDAAYAAETVFKEPIAPGMYSAAFISSLFELIMFEPSQGHRFRFKGAVRKGDVLVPVIYKASKESTIYDISCLAVNPLTKEETEVIDGEILLGNAAEKPDMHLPLPDSPNSKQGFFGSGTINQYFETLGLSGLADDYPQGFVPTMLVGACFTELMLREAGLTGAYREQAMNFHAAVLRDEEITLVGEAQGVREKLGVKTCDFALAVYRDSELVASGTSKGFC